MKFIAYIACVVVSALGIDQGRADVIVLANRAGTQVPLRFAPVSGNAQQLTLPAGDTVPLFLDGKAEVSFASKSAPKRYMLDANCAYYFGRSADGRIELQKIGLGEDGTAAEGRKLPGGAASAPTAMIPVKILVDGKEPARPAVWERRLRARVETASGIFEKQCRVGFKVVAVGTWNSNNATTDFFEALAEFEREVDPAPAKIAIGFTSQWPMVRGRIHMAGTRGPMHSHILVREGSPEIGEGERLEFLVHELGHYLGAAHSPEHGTVMRPVLGNKQAGPAGFKIQFDPVNTLAMAMIGEEMRRSNLTHLSQLQYATRRRLEQIYIELARALPDDPAGLQYAMLMRTTETPLVTATKQVLQQIVHAAIENRALPVRASPISGDAAQPAQRDGDALTDYYVRGAAKAASSLSSDVAQQAFLLALAVGLDDSNALANVAGIANQVRAVEPPGERMTRLAMIGRPTMRGRSDLKLHFFLSAYLTAAGGADAAQNALLESELRNAQGPTGLSFKVIAADRAGSRFARSLVGKRLSLRTLATAFSVESFMPEVDALAEGVTAKDFASQFGAKNDPRFSAKLREIDDLILRLSGYRTATR